MKKYYIVLFLTVITCFNAQTNSDKVGINTNNPTETLDVNGVAHADLLYLRQPGEPLELPINFMASASSRLDVYDPTLGNSGLVNYLNLKFVNVSGSGVTSYNTKISADDFIAAVRTFSLENYIAPTSQVPNPAADIEVYTVHNNNTGSNQSNYYQGSPDFATYVAPSNPSNPNSPKTWWVRARYLNSKFSKSDASASSSDRFNIILQILVYKKLITKYVDTVQTTNLGGNDGSASTYSIPKPSGF